MRRKLALLLVLIMLVSAAFPVYAEEHSLYHFRTADGELMLSSTVLYRINQMLKGTGYSLTNGGFGQYPGTFPPGMTSANFCAFGTTVFGTQLLVDSPEAVTKVILFSPHAYWGIFSDICMLISAVGAVLDGNFSSVQEASAYYGERQINSILQGKQESVFYHDGIRCTVSAYDRNTDAGPLQDCSITITFELDDADLQELAETEKRLFTSEETNAYTDASVIRRLAERGNPRAQVAMGYLYELGLGVTRSFQSAMKWYLQAGQQQYPDAMRRIGDLYFFGLGVEQDSATAANWYRMAAGFGSGAAMNRLGEMYVYGMGVCDAQDSSTGAEWFRQAAALGNAKGLMSLSRANRYWLGARGDLELGTRYYIESVNNWSINDNGSPWEAELEYRVEPIYGGDMLYSEAAILRRAQMGHSQDMESIALRYYQSGNYADAIDWFRMAAKENSEQYISFDYLGMMYSEGLGTKKNAALGEKYCELSNFLNDA